MEAFTGQNHENDSTENVQVNVGFKSWEGLKFSFSYRQYRKKPECVNREICMLM
jgi:hypothetical protein